MKKTTIMYLLIFIAIVLFVVYVLNFRMSVSSAGSSSSSSSNAKKEDFYPGFSSDGLTNPYVSQFSNW